MKCWITLKMCSLHWNAQKGKTMLTLLDLYHGEYKHFCEKFREQILNDSLCAIDNVSWVVCQLCAGTFCIQMETTNENITVQEIKDILIFAKHNHIHQIAKEFDCVYHKECDSDKIEIFDI